MSASWPVLRGFERVDVLFSCGGLSFLAHPPQHAWVRGVIQFVVIEMFIRCLVPGSTCPLVRRWADRQTGEPVGGLCLLAPVFLVLPTAQCDPLPAEFLIFPVFFRSARGRAMIFPGFWSP